MTTEIPTTIIRSTTTTSTTAPTKIPTTTQFHPRVNPVAKILENNSKSKMTPGTILAYLAKKFAKTESGVPPGGDVQNVFNIRPIMTNSIDDTEDEVENLKDRKNSTQFEEDIVRLDDLRNEARNLKRIQKSLQNKVESLKTVVQKEQDMINNFNAHPPSKG